MCVVKTLPRSRYIVTPATAEAFFVSLPFNKKYLLFYLLPLSITFVLFELDINGIYKSRSFYISILSLVNINIRSSMLCGPLAFLFL